MTPPPSPVAEIVTPFPVSPPVPAPANPLFDAGAGAPQPPAAEPPLEETSIVRPYAITGGRTKASYALELETLISSKEGDVGEAVREQIEFGSIVEECRTPRSVAEIVSVLRVPLGVARVLISDAADAGLVTVHRTISGDDNAEAHLMLMERVLSGLRRL
ncbi:DUF742 domain-containing protein [Amycolatopsis suaedae]|uniref:DUF742 domain-containing protein n=2 Tax=Amycolatopsis suaedae TaxID=2510978 RepID=A0A4V2ELZ4_9PSEU|nr:DUF742 domain-containing protein [Amycolatopsis suaedae]